MVFELFSSTGKGKKTDKAPCKVTAPDVTFGDLSETDKARLVAAFVRQAANGKYLKLSRGYVSTKQHITNATDVIKGLGNGNPTVEQITAIAKLMATQQGDDFVDTPVTSFELSLDEILGSDAEESVEEGEAA